MNQPDRPHPSVVFTELDDSSAALLHLESKRYYTLNETGTLLWQQLETGADRTAMAEALTEQFEVDSQAAAAAVAEFLGELRAEGLLSSS